MVIQMTRAEYEAKYGVPVASTPVKMTRAEYEAKYGQKPVSQSFLSSSSPSFSASQTGKISDVPINVAKAFGNIPSSARNLIRGAVAPVNPFDTESALNIGANIVKGGQALSDIFGTAGFVGGVKAIKEGVVDTFGKGVDMAKSVASMTPAEITQKVAITGIEDPLLIPSLLYAPSKIRGTGITKDTISTLAKPVTRGVDTSLETVLPKAKEVASESVDLLRKKAVDDLEQTYSELSSGTTLGKKKIAKIETKTEMLNRAGTEGKTPMRTLSEEGIIPKRSGPKLDTFDQANQYRQKITPLRDANRNALKEVGLSTTPRKLDELEMRAIEYAKTPQNIDAGRFDKMEKEIRAEFDLLRKNYPTGEIPLSKVDEIKSARWDNVFKNKGLIDADVLKKDSEYAIAKSLQKDIEEVSAKSGNAEVAQLNREIGDRLEAAKFLEDLNGKTIKGGRLLKYVTTAIGSSVGTTLPGRLVGALGGNLVGELIIANNVASPLKRLLLRNLQKTDPQAYTNTIKWLEKQNLDRETRLLLPAPSGKIINQGLPIELPAPGVFEGQRKVGEFFLPQSKSPTAQQTNPAIINIESNAIPPSITQRAENVKGITNPDFNRAHYALSEATAGKRAFIPQKNESTSKVVAIPSTFPEWLPKEVKLKSKLDAFIEKYSKGTYFEKPDYGAPVADRKIYDALAKEYPDAVRKPIIVDDSFDEDIMNAWMKNKQGGFISTGYKETGDLTTKILKDLEGKTTVSKQYILDATNRGELKQVERDLIRDILKSEKDTINVSDFAKKVKAELLPLKVKVSGKVSEMNDPRGSIGVARWEGISLKEDRGNVKDYIEHVYESPIKTSAGNQHFSKATDSYFGHTRIEDMADNKTRRVIEVQSDLYQKGNLERETIEHRGQRYTLEQAQKLQGNTDRFVQASKKPVLEKSKELAKLQQYNDPTAHFRMVREEIKKASQDGKTKLQFPTGETAMKIEGLGQETGRWIIGDELLDTNKLRVGLEITPNGQRGYGNDWIITDVLGDGKFKAVQKSKLQENLRYNLRSLSGEKRYHATKQYEEIIEQGRTPTKKELDDLLDTQVDTETFDISGKVDTNNPIYKFYEKDVQKYLNKFGGKRVVDDKGVSWIEVPITKEQGKLPVEAFGKVRLNPLLVGAGIGAGAVGASQFLPKQKE